MTTNEKVARRKLSLLELAKMLNNVSKACKFISYSYEISCFHQTYVTNDWLDRLLGCKGGAIATHWTLEDVQGQADQQERGMQAELHTAC